MQQDAVERGKTSRWRAAWRHGRRIELAPHLSGESRGGRLQRPRPHAADATAVTATATTATISTTSSATTATAITTINTAIAPSPATTPQDYYETQSAMKRTFDGDWDLALHAHGLDRVIRRRQAYAMGDKTGKWRKGGDEELKMLCDAEVEEVKPRTPKPARARKAVVYAVESDDGDEFDDESESEDEEGPDSEFGDSD